MSLTDGPRSHFYDFINCFLGFFERRTFRTIIHALINETLTVRLLFKCYKLSIKHVQSAFSLQIREKHVAESEIAV